MEYKGLNDNELLFMVKEEHEEASELLINKYKYIIDIIMKKYIKIAFTLGLDECDLYQEGMIGLVHAIKTYKSEKNVLFYTYASVCIESQVKTSLRIANRKKNVALNNSVSLDKDVGELKLSDLLISEENSPIDKVLIKEREENIKEYLFCILTKFERKVFDLRLQNFSNQEIALLLKKERRSIENTIQRIRKKYKKFMEENTL